MQETLKILKYFPEIKKYLTGYGIDIGCGDCPVTENCIKFDKDIGDANNINEYYEDNTFDFVFSSHCLEHMNNPYISVKSWWSKVKIGGYLIVAVPDEDLYEQGVFPSRFNTDHKHTFTIYKEKSWSNVSVNIVDLINLLENRKIIYVGVQDSNYDYILPQGVDQTMQKDVLAQNLFIIQKTK